MVDVELTAEQELANKILQVINKNRLPPVNSVAACAIAIAAITAQCHYGSEAEIANTIAELANVIIKDVERQRCAIKATKH